MIEEDKQNKWISIPNVVIKAMDNKGLKYSAVGYKLFLLYYEAGLPDLRTLKASDLFKKNSTYTGNEEKHGMTLSEAVDRAIEAAGVDLEAAKMQHGFDDEDVDNVVAVAEKLTACTRKSVVIMMMEKLEE